MFSPVIAKNGTVFQSDRYDCTREKYIFKSEIHIARCHRSQKGKDELFFTEFFLLAKLNTIIAF